MFSFLYNSFNSKKDEELKSEINRNTGLSAFSDAVNNDIKEESTQNLVARDPVQPSKAPLFDVKSNYSLSAEERLQELFLEYFNYQGNKGFDGFTELEAGCESDEMKAVLELVTLFKRSARLGDGKKTTYLMAIDQYLHFNPGRTYLFLMLVGLLGSCKDYRVLGNSKNETLANATAEFYFSFLVESFDIFSEKNKESKGFNALRGLRGLFFKWMPINGRHRKSKFYNNIISLYKNYKFGEDRQYNNVCRHFRKFVVRNRKTSEQVMSRGLANIDGTEDGLKFLNSISSVARTKHSGYTIKKCPRAIDRCLPNSLEEWRRGLLRNDGTAKVNTAGGTVSAISVLDQYMDDYVNSLLGYSSYYRSNNFKPLTPEQEVTFREILEKGQEVTKDMDMVPMIDLSGSMIGPKAIHLALVLAMIFTMRPKGHPLDGVWVAFSDNAKIVNMGHCETASEWLSKFRNVVQKDSSLVGLSTNYEKALNNLISFSEKHQIEVPDVLVVTDMRVNDFRGCNSGINGGGGGYYGYGESTFSDGDTVFTEKTLNMIKAYNTRMGFESVPNTFIVNCSRSKGLVPMTAQFENGAYYACGTKGTQVSVLEAIKAFCELKFDEIEAKMCSPTPWTTMLKTLSNFNDKLKNNYEVDLLGDVMLLGEDWF